MPLTSGVGGQTDANFNETGLGEALMVADYILLGIFTVEMMLKQVSYT